MSHHNYQQDRFHILLLTDDFYLAAAVAEASLAIKESEFIVDYSAEEAIEDSYRTIKSLEKRYDEYVSEFADLLKELL